MPGTLDEIIKKDILDIMGIQNISEDTKNELYQQLYKTLQNMVIVRISDQLNEDEFNNLSDLLESGRHEEIASYFEQHSIDIKKLFAEEAVSLKLQMASLVDLAKEEKGGSSGGTAPTN